MKTLNTVCFLLSLGVLAGCSTKISEPDASPSSKQGTVATKAHRVATPGDVAPASISARPPQSVALDLVRVSMPISPIEQVVDAGETVRTSHTDALKLIPAGTSVSQHQLAIDVTDGESYLYLSPKATSTDDIHAALRGVQVFDPNGVQVNVRPPKGNSQHEDLVPMSAIPLAGHPAGVYTVKLNDTARRIGLTLDARLATSPLVMTLKPQVAQHLLGNQQSVEMTLVDGGTPVSGASVKARLVLPDHTDGAEVTFVDAGGGVYRATIHDRLTANDVTGAYLLDVTAEGATPNGTRFLRHGRTGFNYGIATARVGDVGAPRSVMDDAGLVKAFEVDVDVESASLDRLELSAMLAMIGPDGVERPVAMAHTGAGLDAGKHTLTLSFDAGLVRMTGLEGDVVLRQVKLFSLGTNTLFHKVGTPIDKPIFTAVRRDQLARVAEITPQLQGLINDGILKE